MRVYAHYLGNVNDCNNSKDGLQYRWRTILQFGESWNVIGSVVMKNPGSAKPLQTKLSEAELKALAHFDNSNTPWYEFTSDNTMHNIEKLFIVRNGGKPLDGVVQIFNLFNIRNADLDKAIKSCMLAKETVLSTIDEDIEAMRKHNSPIYIGWGALGTDQRFMDKANKYFQFARFEMNQKYLYPEFEDNKFYHPQYLMGRGINMSKSQYLLNAFCQNTQNPKYKCTTLPKVIVSKKEVYDEILDRLKTKTFVTEEPIIKNAQTSRFKLNEDLEITITITGEGYIGIRHLNYKQKYSIFEYPNTDKYRQVLEEFKYDMTQDMWLGTKSFKKYGNDTENVIKSILDEIDKLQKSLS